jgi:hypothetical protein
VKLARRIFYITFTVSAMLGTLDLSHDPVAQLGWYLHIDLKSWAPIGIPFSLVELSLIACAIAWLFRSRRDRRRYPFLPGTLMAPVLVLGAAILFAVLWSLSRPGDNLNVALFEVRGFGIMIFAYLLVGMVLYEDKDLQRLVWCVLIACTWLTIDNTLRYYILLRGETDQTLAYAYDHDDAVVLCAGMILCLALVVFGGSRAQRRYAMILLPAMFWCVNVMHRREAYAMLAVGLIVFGVAMYRLRPKVFWRFIPALAVLALVYLAVFWNNGGTLGQPARAIRSIVTPDPRDAISNDYRRVEHANLVNNIRTSRIFGLGFGQPYVFYYPLPDLQASWPFYRYETHDAVVWVWMDGGIAAFFAFFWLLGNSVFQGGLQLAQQREVWSLSQLRLRPRSERGSAPRAATGSNAVPGLRAKPTIMQEGGTALLVMASCQIAVELAYAYVDLGLISGRDMLVLGVCLGVLGRTFVQSSQKQRNVYGPARRDAQVNSPHLGAPAESAPIDSAPPKPVSRWVAPERQDLQDHEDAPHTPMQPNPSPTKWVVHTDSRIGNATSAGKGQVRHWRVWTAVDSDS